MQKKDGYGLFCPISKACEILEPRWTLLVLAEMFCGSTRFNDIRRGLPGMSPTLLSKRLKDMEIRGIIQREVGPKPGQIKYSLTPMAAELRPIVMAMGQWSLKNVETSVKLQDLDADLLMWNLRRNLNPNNFQAVRTVIQFIFESKTKAVHNYWLVARTGTEVDLCKADPGFDVDLIIEADLRSLTDIFLGHIEISKAISDDNIILSGEPELAATISSWLRKIPFAL